MRTRSIQILSDRLFWISEDISQSEVGRGQIVEHLIGTTETRVRYRAEDPLANINDLSASSDWVVWLEHRDRRTLRDAKLVAVPVRGGDRIVVEDFSRYVLARFPDIALDGSDVYWTLPLLEGGVWHGRLMRRRLPTGESTVLVQAPSGALLGWPSARMGAYAYEVARQDQQPSYAVRYHGSSGEARELPSPSSEPTIGDGFVAFKAADRFSSGALAAFVLGAERVVALGPGEAPRAAGAFAVWHSIAPGSVGNYVAMPRSGCVLKLGDEPSPREGSASSPAIATERSAWLLRIEADPEDRIRTAPLLRAAC